MDTTVHYVFGSRGLRPPRPAPLRAVRSPPRGLAGRPAVARITRLDIRLKWILFIRELGLKLSVNFVEQTDRREKPRNRQ